MHVSLKQNVDVDHADSFLCGDLASPLNAKRPDLFGIYAGGTWHSFGHQETGSSGTKLESVASVAPTGHRGDGVHLHVRRSVCVVMGPPFMADSQRDSHLRHSLGRPEHCRVGQHVLHFPRGTVLPLHHVRYEMGDLSLLRGLGGHHASLSVVVCARDQGNAYCIHGPCVEATLVLEEVHAPCTCNPTRGESSSVIRLAEWDSIRFY